MKLPNGAKAVIDEEKLIGYLLSQSHPVGRFKAQFFASIGIGYDNRELLRSALAVLAANADAKLGRKSEFGQKYLIPGRIQGPLGSADIVSVWVVLSTADTPRLVTVYPR